MSATENSSAGGNKRPVDVLSGNLHIRVAETPEEIAVSIMSEVIMVQRGGSGGPLSVT